MDRSILASLLATEGRARECTYLILRICILVNGVRMLSMAMEFMYLGQGNLILAILKEV